MKRLLVFVLLLGLGFAALRLALGDEPIASADRRDVAQPQTTRPPDERTGGTPIRLQQDGTELQVRGGFVIGRHRSVASADGLGTDRQPVYELECGDCTPTDGGRHRLVDVTMRLFDRGVHAANLTARQALVELQVDAQQQRSLRENRELDLTDAVFAAIPGSRLSGLRLEIGRVRALLDGDVVVLNTPDENEPVTVVVDGARRGELRGRGLRARVPKDRDAALGRLDLLLLHEPSIAMSGLDLHANGQLHYVEVLASGGAMLTVDDDVRVELASARLDAGPTRGDAPLTVRGDRLHGWLQRSQASGAGMTGRQTLEWTLLRLLGAPAHVHTGDLDLTSPRLTVLPGPTGELAAITADGGASELHGVVGGTGAGTGPAFRSPRPIHLLRTAGWLGAVHRQFGFPDFALGPLADLSIVTFDGAAEVDAGDGVHVAADRGLHLFQQQSAAATGLLVACGFGNVRITRGIGEQQFVASGNAGFVLTRTLNGDDAVLGRDDPTADQEFTLTRGNLQLQGRGAARLLRDTDETVTIRLRSDQPTIHGTFGRTAGQTIGGEVQQVRELTVTARGQDVVGLLATGAETTFVLENQDQRLLGSAARIEQIGPIAWRLSGLPDAPATLQLPPTAAAEHGELAAPTIFLYRVAARAVLLDAQADAQLQARLSGDLRQVGRDKTTALTTRAQRIRLLPFAVGPALLTRHLFGLPSGLGDIVAGSLAQPWLLAEGKITADAAESADSELHGEGELLAASAAGEALLLGGDAAQGTPARLRRVEHGAEQMVATGARLQFAPTDGERLSVLTTFPGQNRLLPPSVAFRATASGDGRIGWVRGECTGEIEVLPDAVLFHGPVTAHSLLPSSDADPDGMQIVAQHLRMTRQRDSHELLRVEADGGVVADLRDLHATSRRVELDLRWRRCIVEDPDDAVLTFGRRSYHGRRIEASYDANYTPYAVGAFGGRVTLERESSARR